MFWSRPLHPQELQFVQQHFGDSLMRLRPRLRLYVRRLGDTRRAWSLNGGRIAMPPQCFDGPPAQPLRLAHAAVAGLFAHELLHQWQRLQGRPVTRQAAWLQGQAMCLRRDPYAYDACDDAQRMLARFLAAQVEQQAQMWEDHVRAWVAGHPKPAFARIAAHVRMQSDGM